MFSTDGSSIDEQVARLLQGRRLAVGESCTGGLLAARLTDRPGSSEYFAGGVVAYSNEAKVELLGVPPELIERHGAVSEEVAVALADGALARFGADTAIGLTGHRRARTAERRTSRSAACASASSRGATATRSVSCARSTFPARGRRSATAPRPWRCTCCGGCCCAKPSRCDPATVLVVGMKPGHDGAIAAIGDRTLLYSLESEKDSFPRHADLTPMSMLAMMERLDAVPDVVAMGGWNKDDGVGRNTIGVGYRGAHGLRERISRFCGKEVRVFSSSHTRSHIMMGAGMAPPDDAAAPRGARLGGRRRTFYLLDERAQILERDPGSAASRRPLRVSLRAWRRPDHPDGRTSASGRRRQVDGACRLWRRRRRRRATCGSRWTGSWHRTGFPSRRATTGTPRSTTPEWRRRRRRYAAALITERIFDIYARVALERLPAGIPLYISGGCGLNCDWNMKWRELGHFSSVFVPPCTTIPARRSGTALDALAAVTGDPRIDWNVYCGLEFEWDVEPDPDQWKRRPLDLRQLADALDNGHVVAWVQGRWEMGPRALGNRSLLAEPFVAQTRDRLNEIKQPRGLPPDRAHAVRLEDAGKLFSADFHDPYMLYFRMVESPDLGAVTHVDGSARAQTVTQEDNKPLHDLLSAFAERQGIGVLCNTSLNYKRFGFINRLSDLAHYCEHSGIQHFVVDDAWFEAVGSR